MTTLLQLEIQACVLASHLNYLVVRDWNNQKLKCVWIKSDLRADRRVQQNKTGDICPAPSCQSSVALGGGAFL